MGDDDKSVQRSKQADEAKAKSKEKPEETKQDCAKQNPKIVSVEFLDGDDEKIVSGTGMQFVNLPSDEKWVDGTIVANKDRLTQKPRIKVKFDKPGAHGFKVEYAPDGANAVYTADEKNRNANFKYQEDKKSYTTDGDGTKIVTNDFFVAAAGNDKFGLKAEDDNGNKVSSTGKIQTDRLVYFVELKMKGLAGVAGSVDTFKNEFKDNYIRLETLGDEEMDHMENISSGDEAAFQNKARTAYQASDGPNKEPYCAAVAYTDHLAVKNPNQSIVKNDVDVGPGKGPVGIDIVGPGLTNPNAAVHCLWNNIVTGEGWFVSCQYLPDGGNPATDTVDIPENKCAGVPVSNANPDAMIKVDVTVDHLPAGKGSITLTVDWVDRMRAGLSFSGGNLICACTKAWWQAISEAEQNQVIIHEMGHKVGMVADGTGTSPEAVSTLYDSSKGHVGNHCYSGNPDGQARYDSVSDMNNSDCVMYGATNGKSSFCANCKPAVRKVDISSGWSAF